MPVLTCSSNTENSFYVETFLLLVALEELACMKGRNRTEAEIREHALGSSA